MSNVANLFLTRKENHKITHTFESQAFNLALHSLNKETAVKWIISINELSYTPSVKMLVFDTNGLPSFADRLRNSGLAQCTVRMWIKTVVRIFANTHHVLNNNHAIIQTPI